MINRGHTHIAFVASYEGGLAAGKKIAAEANKISAVATIADICAIGIMEGTRLGDLRIPVDLSIVGYDNLSLCQCSHRAPSGKNSNRQQDPLRGYLKCGDCGETVCDFPFLI